MGSVGWGFPTLAAGGERDGRGEPVLGRSAVGVRWGPKRTPVVHGGHFRIMAWKQWVARGH